jgi:hypothetical protein
MPGDPLECDARGERSMALKEGMHTIALIAQKW